MENDIGELVKEGRLNVEDAFVGEGLLKVVNEAEENEFTSI